VRDFTWHYFWSTGEVDAYLLYKDLASDPELAGEELMEQEQEAVHSFEA